ncbi:MAG: LssY C-terminal domain-containing protein [Myxococcales bacterium]|nr:LssY C-terminal domain-containing protein [Myxococcales bacterium]
MSIFSALATVHAPRFVHHVIDAAEAEAKHVGYKVEDAAAEALGYCELLGVRYPVKAYQFQVSKALTRGSRVDEKGLRDLKTRGFRGVVNLCREYDDSDRVRKAGLVPLHLAILDNTAPDESSMVQFLDFVSDPANQPVYVHCEAGKGRTGCAVASYRMAIQRWTDPQALEDAKKFGLQLDVQVAFIRRFHSSLLATKYPPYPIGSGAAARLWTLPRQGQWTSDAHGKKSDPVNVYAFGPFAAFEKAVLASGWTRAMDNKLSNNARYIDSAVEFEGVTAEDAIARLMDRVPGMHVAQMRIDEDDRKVVASMPVSMQTLDGRPFVAAYECANNPVGGRHHIRVFDARAKDAHGRPVWAIAATQDVGIMFDPKRPEQGFMNHRVAANTDGERDFLCQALRSAGAKIEMAGPIECGAKNQYGVGPGDSRVVLTMFN